MTRKDYVAIAESATEKKYMNISTGSVDTHDGWWYEDEDGVEVNAVDRGEVVEHPLHDRD